MKRDAVCRLGAVLFAGIAAVFWFVNPVLSRDPIAQTLWRASVIRLLGSAVFLFVLFFLRFRVWQKPQKGWWKAFLPALLIALNNLPTLALISGWAQVERTGLVWLFALETLSVGLFEELAFRGVLFPLMLEKYGKTGRGIRWTVVLSSALFGLVHLINLMEGAGFGATVLQVGYSFLIGGMCAVVLLKTGNLLFCILIHTVYDFCGGLIPTLGSGALWDVPTVVLTAVLAIAVAAWMLYLLFGITPETVRKFYDDMSRRSRMNTISISHSNAQIVAHRGLSGLEKENTLTAFVAAGNRSYWGVETDIHFTADKQLIVIHDSNTKRVTGAEYIVEETDFDTLRAIPLLDREGKPGRVDLRMPSLKEYIRTCKQYGKKCVLEIKKIFPEEGIRRMLDEIREEDYLDNVIFIAFDREDLIEVRKHCPGHPVQQLSSTMDEELFEFLKEQKFDLDIDYRALTEEWVTRLHEAGIRVNCWTVNDPEVAERLISWGVDYITTNILE